MELLMDRCHVSSLFELVKDCILFTLKYKTSQRQHTSLVKSKYDRGGGGKNQGGAFGDFEQTTPL